MANLYTPGNSADGIVYGSNATSWAGARDMATGSSAITTHTILALTQVYKFASRGGPNPYRIARSFMYFDTSGISGTVSSAIIKIRGRQDAGGSIIAVKSTAFGGDGGTALSTADLDAITGYSAGASLAGNATDYSDTILTGSWNASGYNDLTGTADLRADMQNNDVVIICFLDYTNDYLNVALPSITGVYLSGYMTDYGGTSLDPYIEYEIATGYGNAINGVAAANIGKVIGGPGTANIEKVIGV